MTELEKDAIDAAMFWAGVRRGTIAAIREGGTGDWALLGSAEKSLSDAVWALYRSDKELLNAPQAKAEPEPPGGLQDVQALEDHRGEGI